MTERNQTMKKPFCILIDGMTGAGKTTVANLLSEKLSRTANIGMDKVKRFISDFQRVPKDNRIACDIVFTMTQEYLKRNISVIVEQPFQKGEIEKYETLALTQNIPIYKVQLHTTPTTALKRVVSRQKDWKNKVPKERINRNIRKFRIRREKSFIVINTTKQTPKAVATKILKIIR